MAVTAFLQVKDNATSTLNGAIDSSTLTIVVADGSVFPTTGNTFMINIDSEDILIDSRSTNTLTVNASGRGYNGTVAASHTNGATVNLTVQAKSLQEIHTAVNTVENASFPGITVALGSILSRQSSGNGALAPLSIGSAGEVLMADAAGVPNYLPLGFSGMLNGLIQTSVASNNLTVAIKGLDGNDPSTTNPVFVRIGNSIRTITSALSVTKNAGTNWCSSGSSETATLEVDYFVYLIWNTTPTPDAVTLGFSRIPYGNLYSDFSGTTTNVKYLAFSGSDTPTSTDEVQVVGRFNAILSATASFNWSLPATSIIIQRPVFSTRSLTWTPTFGTSSAMTWSTSPTTLTAKYYLKDTKLFCSLSRYATTAGGGSGSLTFTLPISTADATGYAIGGACLVVVAGSPIAGFWKNNSATVIQITRYDNSEFSSGGVQQIVVDMEAFI